MYCEQGKELCVATLHRVIHKEICYYDGQSRQPRGPGDVARLFNHLRSKNVFTTTSNPYGELQGSADEEDHWIWKDAAKKDTPRIQNTFARILLSGIGICDPHPACFLAHLLQKDALDESYIRAILCCELLAMRIDCNLFVIELLLTTRDIPRDLVDDLDGLCQFLVYSHRWDLLRIVLAKCPRGREREVEVAFHYADTNDAFTVRQMEEFILRYKIRFRLLTCAARALIEYPQLLLHNPHVIINDFDEFVEQIFLCRNRELVENHYWPRIWSDSQWTPLQVIDNIALELEENSEYARWLLQKVAEDFGEQETEYTFDGVRSKGKITIADIAELHLLHLEHKTIYHPVVAEKMLECFESVPRVYTAMCMNILEYVEWYNWRMEWTEDDASRICISAKHPRITEITLQRAAPDAVVIVNKLWGVLTKDEDEDGDGSAFRESVRLVTEDPTGATALRRLFRRDPHSDGNIDMFDWLIFADIETFRVIIEAGNDIFPRTLDGVDWLQSMKNWRDNLVCLFRHPELSKTLRQKLEMVNFFGPDYDFLRHLAMAAQVARTYTLYGYIYTTFFPARSLAETQGQQQTEEDRLTVCLGEAGEWPTQEKEKEDMFGYDGGAY